MTMSLAIDIKFTERAAGYLAHVNSGNLTFPSTTVREQPLLPGDKLRIAGIPNCPWFVVSERYWTLGEASTLTIWLDEAED